MPLTSRAFIRASIVYLCLGAVIGALLLVNRWLPLSSEVARLKPSHVQFLVVGWLTQLIMGVAWWLFPPLSIGLDSGAPKPARSGQQQRGSEPLFWLTFIFLNAGILFRALFEPLYSWTRIGFFWFLTGISGILLAVAAVAFVINMWGRVRELRRQRASTR